MRIALAFSLLLIGSCTRGLPEKSAILPVKQIVVRLTLPQQCAHLSREPDPATWDEEKNEYPRNYAWERCMGIAPR